jgi:hypothetical protein
MMATKYRNTSGLRLTSQGQRCQLAEIAREGGNVNRAARKAFGRRGGLAASILLGSKISEQRMLPCPMDQAHETPHAKITIANTKSQKRHVINPLAAAPVAASTLRGIASILGGRPRLSHGHRGRGFDWRR